MGYFGAFSSDLSRLEGFANGQPFCQYQKLLLIWAICGLQKLQSKTQVVFRESRFFLKIFYSFSHIELRESAIVNYEPFSHQMRKSALIIEGRVLFEPPCKSKS